MSSAAGAEPRSIVYPAPTRAAGAVPMVAVIAAVTKDHLFLVLGVFTQLTRYLIKRGSTGSHHGLEGVPRVIAGHH